LQPLSVEAAVMKNAGKIGSPTAAAVAFALFLAVGGCATMTPEGRRAFQVYWDAARGCERQYSNLHVDRVQPNGDLLLSADHDIRRNMDNFTRCYHEALGAAAGQLREQGDVVANSLNVNPTVDMD
jgi:hypothetical protein